jgi:magnesium transporter
MSVLSLLGNKADVIRGFAKRCNEQWAVAPRNEIGLYLGDIQDHIVTMVQSLNHYEKLLARSHSNYLAQINIDMTKTNNDMNDVLSRITVLGTIVLPMNIVTGLWGMNVPVPGQESIGTLWFYTICCLLFAFAVVCYLVMRKVFRLI